MARRFAFPARLAGRCLPAVRRLLSSSAPARQLRAGPASRADARRHRRRPASAGWLAAVLDLAVQRARLEAATTIAGRFAAGYDTWSWSQPTPAWLAHLRPMITNGLYAALARAASIPAVVAQRDATRQASVGTLKGMAIRDLSPGSITFVVTVSQVDRQYHRHEAHHRRLAVTLISPGQRLGRL